jgi:hypothetical protein
VIVNPLVAAAAGDIYFKGANTLEQRRQAAVTVGRATNQHGCSASAGQPCGHPDHRRDVHFCRTLLEMLDLLDLSDDDET